MRNIVRLGGLFVGSAVLAFVLVVPRMASSQTRSVAGTACPLRPDNLGSTYNCPIMTDSTTYTVSALSGAWFDFACTGPNHSVVYKLKKISWSGTATFDHTQADCVGVSNEHRWRAAQTVLENADTWDHLYADVEHTGPRQIVDQPASPTFFGITACFSGGANDCS